MIDFNSRLTAAKIHDFVEHILELSKCIGFKVSARGWCYLMEQEGYIDKSQFDKVEYWINTARRKGLLPIDFTKSDAARHAEGVESFHVCGIKDHITYWLDTINEIPRLYEPSWWQGEKFYIQMIVEKDDLVTLFSPVLSRYHIPISNAKGWSSMLQRAAYTRRFKEAEDLGLQCVLLYFGDHDPDGLRIAENIRKNLHDLEDIKWGDGCTGYNPSHLMIDRVGLTYKFIGDFKLTWIDNLITGGKKDLASPAHRNFKLPYVQKYLKTIGKKKCEANVCVTIPDISRKYLEAWINRYYDKSILERWKAKVRKVRGDITGIMEEQEIFSTAKEWINNIEGREE